jgi:hypothetical protein
VTAFQEVLVVIAQFERPSHGKTVWAVALAAHRGGNGNMTKKSAKYTKPVAAGVSRTALFSLWLLAALGSRGGVFGPIVASKLQRGAAAGRRVTTANQDGAGIDRHRPKVA